MTEKNPDILLNVLHNGSLKITIKNWDIFSKLLFALHMRIQILIDISNGWANYDNIFVLYLQFQYVKNEMEKLPDFLVF